MGKGENMDLRELRSKLGWSQERLARELRVSLSTLRGWEYGDHRPSPMAEERIQTLMGRLGFLVQPEKDLR